MSSRKRHSFFPDWDAFKDAAYERVQAYKVAREGNWRIEKRTITESEERLGMMRAASHGSRRYVRAGEFTGLMHGAQPSPNDSPIMSNTFDEIRDLMTLQNHAKGRVLLNGLGLGCAVWGLLTMKEVEHVDVVEISADVLKLVTPYFIGKMRVTFHHADAFKIQWPKGTRWNAVWHDIWSDVNTEDLKQHTILKRRYAQRCDWQKAWIEDTLRYYKQRGM